MTPLPHIFDPLQPLLKVKYRGASHGWTAANCPVCGIGDDRLILTVAGMGRNTHTKAYCRQCGRTVWRPDSTMRKSAGRNFVPELMPKPDYDKLYAKLVRHQNNYIKSMTDHAIEQWMKRGVGNPGKFSLGFKRNGRWQEGDVRFTTDSLTIPFIHAGKLLHIQHRLQRIPEDVNRYRWDVAGLPFL